MEEDENRLEDGCRMGNAGPFGHRPETRVGALAQECGSMSMGLQINGFVASGLCVALMGAGCAPTVGERKDGAAAADEPEAASEAPAAEDDTDAGTPGGSDAVDGLPPIAWISVTVDDGREPDNFPERREWMSADIVVQADGAVVHQGRAGIHVRGNTSAWFDKKSYALETWDADDEDLDVSLLGLPAEEDWVLQGPYSDKSLIRNHLTYSLYRDIGRYAARTRFVELEVNEDYRGIYVLMEKIKRDPVRMDLPTGAVLLKRDWVEGGPAFIRTDACRDTVKVEWPDDPSGVVERLNRVEQALLDGELRSVDLESFVDHMLTVELGRNVDGYVLSTWITLSEDDVLGMGPVWDYNGALGNASYFRAWNPEGWHYENPEFPADNPNGFCWYESLLADPDFLELRRTRWQAHRAGAWSDAAIEARIDEAVGVIQPAVDANFERWPILGEEIWPNDAGAEDRLSYAEEVAYLKSWMLQRTAWLDSQL